MPDAAGKPQSHAMLNHELVLIISQLVGLFLASEVGGRLTSLRPENSIYVS